MVAVAVLAGITSVSTPLPPPKLPARFGDDLGPYKAKQLGCRRDD